MLARREYRSISRFVSRVFLDYFYVCAPDNPALRPAFAVRTARSKPSFPNFPEPLWSRSQPTPRFVVRSPLQQGRTHAIFLPVLRYPP
jgi:hypothetical protein